MKKYENKKTCARCGGKCCDSSPGMYIPADFGKPDERFDNILKAIKSAKVRIDSWVDGKTGDDIFYVRPQTIRDNGEFMHFAWGGRCKLAGPDGCELKYWDRPFECKTLIPRSRNDKCKKIFSRETIVYRWWLPYLEEMKKIIKIIESQCKTNA